MMQGVLFICLFTIYHIHEVKSYDSNAYKNPHYVEGRTTMVHLFEWKFKDIALECERFLGPMGFGGVQVSPITENIIIPGRPWYERYQPISYEFITRSGNESEFAEMVSRCNKVGVRIYVDAVINHMTADSIRPIGTGGSIAYPLKRNYPNVSFGEKDFNYPCSIDGYNNASVVRNCELVGLHDLNQRNEHVRNKIVELLNRAIDLGVAGFRIDAGKHMWPEDLEVIFSRMKNLREDIFGHNKRPFIFLEVISFSRNEACNKWEYKHLGDVIDFVFGHTLGRYFRNIGKLSYLETWGFEENNLLPSNDAVVMIDNHDNQRGHGGGGNFILTYKDSRLYKMATAFMLAHPYGHPRVMSSFDFSDPNSAPPMDENEAILSPNAIIGDVNSVVHVNLCGNGWICEHRWRQIYNMVKFRNVVGNADFRHWWSNGDNQIAFSRDDRGFVTFNGQYGVDLKKILQTGMAPGKYCDVITGRIINGTCTGKVVTVDNNGYAYIEILKDEKDGTLAIHVEVKL